MSSSAGKVLLIPKGEYNAATEYKVLDWVLYNGRPYVAKQTTTGNLPTNTTYWQILLDFPTEVDNAPTQNSPNLVRSGGVYDATATKMEVDGSNSDKILMQNSYEWIDSVDTITKDAGDNQTVTMTKTVSSSSNLSVDAIVARLSARIGDTSLRTYSLPRIGIIIDTVSNTDNVITITGHLKDDDTAAINRGITQLEAYNYTSSSSLRNIIAGVGSAINGVNNEILGKHNAVTGDEGFVNGNNNVINSSGSGAMASGSYNFVNGMYDAHAFGSRLVAGHSRQFVCGLSNDNKADTLFEVGDGTLSGSRKNAFEVYPGGYVSFNNGTDLYKFAKSNGKDGYYDTNDTFHAFSQPLYLTQSVTLSTSADTTVTFSNAAITTDSMIDVYTNVYGVNPSNISVSTGSCTLTFAKASTAQTISVRIKVENT